MFLNDFRYAIRMLRRTPLFTFAAILTLALGIGVTTAIFIVVNTEMLRALPFGHPSRLVWVAEKNDKLKLPVWAASVLNHLSWKEQTKTVDSLSLIGFGSFNLTGRSDPEQIPGSTISPPSFLCSKFTLYILTTRWWALPGHRPGLARFAGQWRCVDSSDYRPRSPG